MIKLIVHLTFLLSLCLSANEKLSIEQIQTDTSEYLDWIEKELKVCELESKALVGKLKGADGISPVNENLLLGAHLNCKEQILSLRKVLDESFKNVKSGSLSYNDFVSSSYGCVSEALSSYWSSVIESNKHKVRFLKQQNSNKQKELTAAMLGGTDRTDIAVKDEANLKAIKKEFKSIADSLREKQFEVIEKVNTWGKKNKIAKTILSSWLKDEVDLTEKSGYFESSFSTYLKTEIWNWTSVAGVTPEVFDLAKYLQRTPDNLALDFSNNRPEYPVKLIVPAAQIHALEVIGPGSHYNYEWSKKYWNITIPGTKTNIRLTEHDNIIAIVGKNILQHIGTSPNITAQESYMTYNYLEGYKYNESPEGYESINKLLVQNLKNRERVEKKPFDYKNLEVVLVRVNAPVNASSNVYQFILNEMSFYWQYRFNRNLGHIGFFRKENNSLYSGRHDVRYALDTIYHKDRIIIEACGIEKPRPENRVLYRIIRTRDGKNTEVQINGKKEFEAKLINLTGYPWSNEVSRKCKVKFHGDEIRFELGVNDSPDDNIIHFKAGDQFVPVFQDSGPLRQASSRRAETKTSPLEQKPSFILALLEIAKLRKIDAVLPAETDPSRDEKVRKLCNIKIHEMEAAGFFVDISSEDKGNAYAKIDISLGELAVLEIVRREMLLNGEKSMSDFENKLKIVLNAGSYKWNDPTPYVAFDQIVIMINQSGNQLLKKKLELLGHYPCHLWHKSKNWKPGDDAPAAANNTLKEMQAPLKREFESMKAAMKKLKTLDYSSDDDVEALFDMVANGSHRWIPRIRGRFVKKVWSADRSDFWWAPDHTPTNMLSNISGKANLIALKRIEADAYDGATSGALALATIPFSCPLWLTLGVASSLESIWEIYQWYVRSEDEDYTESMSILLGSYYMGEKLAAAQKLHKEGWLVFVNLIINSIGGISDGISLGNRMLTLREYSIIKEVNSENFFISIVRKPRYADGEQMLQGASAVRRALKYKTVNFSRENFNWWLIRLTESPRESLAQLIFTKTDDFWSSVTTTKSAYSSLDVSGPYIKKIKDAYNTGSSTVWTMSRSDDSKSVQSEKTSNNSLDHDSISSYLRDMHKRYRYLPNPGAVWRGYKTKKALGNGSFSFIYELENEKVLKVGALAKGLENKNSFVRRKNSYKLLEQANIPVLKTNWNKSKVFDDTYAIVQERLPKGSVLLRRGLVKKYSNHALKSYTPLRIQGIDSKNLLFQQGLSENDIKVHVKDKTMPAEFSIAICQLYKKFADKQLIWFDGSLNNILLVKNGTEWGAKVIETDLIWKWTDKYNGSHLDEGSVEVIEEYYDSFGNPRHVRKWANRTQSMAGFKRDQSIFMKMDKGEHLLPNTTVFMMKMLEFHGYIHYDRVLGKWIDGTMKIEDVKKVFSEIDDPSLIDLKKE